MPGWQISPLRFFAVHAPPDPRRQIEKQPEQDQANHDADPESDQDHGAERIGRGDQGQLEGDRIRIENAHGKTDKRSDEYGDEK